MRAGPSALAIDREGCSELREGRQFPPHFVLHTRPYTHSLSNLKTKQARAERHLAQTTQLETLAVSTTSSNHPILHSLALVAFPLFHSRPSLNGLKRCFRLPPSLHHQLDWAGWPRSDAFLFFVPVRPDPSFWISVYRIHPVLVTHAFI